MGHQYCFAAFFQSSFHVADEESRFQDLVCSLAEHSCDDDSIVSVCLRLRGDDASVARVLSFLDKRKRDEFLIMAFVTSLGNNK